MYFVFNILALLLVKTFTSVDSNITTDLNGFEDQSLKTTASDSTDVLQANETIALASDTTHWFTDSQRIVTDRPTTLYVTQRKTTDSDVDLTDRYTETERVTQTLTKNSYAKPMTLTSPPMAAVFEDPNDANTGRRDGMEPHESVTSKSLLTKYSDQSIYTGNKGGVYDHICDFCLYEGQGNFTSYGYPLNYRNNLNCTYRVMRTEGSDVCEIELYFHVFDVSVSSLPSTAFQSTKTNNRQNKCLEDYLEVNDRRYCGNGWRHHSEIISFPSNQRELVFRFVSNEKTNGKGFWAEVRRRPNTCYGTRLKTQASEVCEERFSEIEFEIKSPGFPNNYPLNANCAYYVRRANEDVCGLELLFFKFETELSEGCAYDYLEIDGQKFCGTVGDSSQKIFKFESNQKMISFQSDSQISKTGFHIHAKQITDCGQTSLPAPPSCNICTSEGFGALVSYGYPDHYRNNLFCTYTIDRRNADYCSVELEFEDFELQNSDNCEADYLQVEGQRFCGDTLKLTKRTIPFDGRDKGIVLLFKTDESKTKRGFLVQYKQLECTDDVNDVVQEKASLPHSAVVPMPQSKCDYVFTDKQFVIRSENFSKSYENNMECSYYVKRNSTKVCYLELTFVKFDVEASPECQYDYLEVGNTVRLCGTLQSETVRTYIFDSNEKLLKFHSDGSNNRNGFLIRAEQLECSGDKIIRRIQPSLTTPSASEVSPTHYSVDDSSFCSQVVDQQEVNIFSPNYPNPYPPNQDCLYMIKKISPNVCKLEVTFDDFEIQPSDPNAYCKYDFFDFNGVRVCGEVIKGDIKSYYFGSETFAIHFHSDNSITSSDRAFRINIRQTDCQQTNQISSVDETRHRDHFQKAYDCNRVYSENSFELKSPNYPQSYPNHLNCKYTILKQRTGLSICQLEVNFIDMDLEKSDDCSHDYLNFNGQLMCGSLSSETTRLYNFQSNQFVINFVSDSYRTQRGFYLTIRQKECLPEDQSHMIGQSYSNGVTQCGGVYNEMSFDLKSPQYPDYYENKAECVYTIRRKNDNICRLELKIIDFDVEPSQGCAYDYLMIDGKKLCGDIQPNYIKTIEFYEKEKTFLFKTSTKSNRRGFLLKANQKQCETSAPTGLVLSPTPAICELCFTEVMGTLQSYDYPNHYPPNLNCKYKITALPGNCMVQLNFDQFRLEVSDSCDSDYLEINNIRYCGTQLEGATLLAFNKKPEDVSIRFVTNGQKSYRGFRASYTQLPCIGGVPSGQQQLTLQQQEQHYQKKYRPQTQPNLDRQPQHQRSPPTGVSHYGSLPIAIVDNGINSSLVRIPCDRVIYDMEFEIKSPNYPNYYPPNNDCLYSIRRSNSNICKLRLKFVFFDLKGEYKECVGDSLEINENKICGSLPMNTIKEFPFNSYKTSLRFRSDSDITSKGFKIIGEQIVCTYDLRSPLSQTSSDQTKQYSSHIPYGQSSVQYSNENTLTSSQSQPIPQPQPRPSYSYSSSVDSQSQQSYSSPPYSPPQSQSQHYYYRPPEPSQHSSQSKPYTEHVSPQQSTSHSNQNYERRVYQPSMSVIKSYPTQQSINYESKSQFQQNQDYRPYSPSQRVHSTSKPQSYRSPQPYQKPYQSSENSDIGADSQKTYQKQSQNQSPYMEVRHKMETTYGSQPTNRCQQKIQNMYFEIKSSKESNSECIYSIQKAKENVCQLDIMFTNFDLDAQSCHKEYMAVDDQKLCGSIDKNTMKTFKFNDNELKIHLKTETMGFSKGLDIKARQVECSLPPAINQQMYGQSQGYEEDKYRMSSNGQSPQPRPYDVRPVPQPQQMTSYEKSLGATASYDYRRPPLPKPMEPIQAFQSNFDGFDIRLSLEPEGLNKRMNPSVSSEERCHLIYSEIEFPITSPNHPKPYPSNMFCRYTIRKANPNVCAIDMKFNSFDIEDDPKCAKDYLEVDAGRICGPLPPSHERRYYFLPEEYEKVLIFKSDESGVKSGFALHVRQITDCTKPWQPMSAPTTPTVCDVCHHNIRGQIMSSNYPNNYNDFMRCSYRIQAMGSDFCKVKLFLRDMDIESSTSGHCMKDALIIDSEKLCGKDTNPKEMTLTFPASEPREVVINFQTDVSGNGRGFLIEYIQESCSLPSNRSPSLTPNRSPSLAQPLTPIESNSNSFPSISVQQIGSKPDQRVGTVGTLIPPIYPPNYVSRAHIEEIVQTQVQVLDKRDNETDQQKSDSLIK